MLQAFHAMSVYRQYQLPHLEPASLECCSMLLKISIFLIRKHHLILYYQEVLERVKHHHILHNQGYQVYSSRNPNILLQQSVFFCSMCFFHVLI